MTTLRFLSPAGCVPEALASPLARALAALDTVSDTDVRTEGHSGGIDVTRCSVRDLSLAGKAELRGDLARFEPAEGEELVRLTPRRGFLLTDDPSGAVERARAGGVLAYDVTGLLAGIELRGEAVMRRLTDLDLDALPAAGPFARVTAIVLRDGDAFRVYVPQELGHDVTLHVLDAYRGLTPEGSDPSPPSGSHA